jgi:hypothetical protein
LLVKEVNSTKASAAASTSSYQSKYNDEDFSCDGSTGAGVNKWIAIRKSFRHH